ncbi:hypothetical protein [Lederbergia lenta]|uniref:Uncharacterized protein n=1 Tax=Lederbergia lenta TaxID=1467 RepID=A0A2X4VLV4_LEDLE|nr:hypothetical protein [Lederbergia lenta]MCM3112370.1 hypothetical protein [Lederbergia lenta]MEC2326589.1 hypothetical protein [Lederbergia lenta]SQI53117.1 Uncharacterised protein [Lederbergia lenta]
MSTYAKSELSLLSELFLAILLTACYGIFCFKSFQPFPWLSFIGAPIGLAIIIACWKMKSPQWTFFIVGLLLNTVIWSIVFNWSSIF